MIRTYLGLICLVCVVCFASDSANAQLGPFSQDFETLTPTGETGDGMGNSDLDLDGWQVNGLAFNGAVGDVSEFLFFYGNFPAPNFIGNPGFSGIVTNQGTGGQGDIHLNTYSDYAQGVAHPGNTAWVETRIFQEQTITAADLGTTWDLSFEFKRNVEVDDTGAATDFGPNGNTQTFAYVRVLDAVSETFATLGECEVDTTAADADIWTVDVGTLEIDPVSYTHLTLPTKRIV